MAITNSQLSSTEKTEVFVGSGENAITCIILCNTSQSTGATVSVWAVPAAIAASDASMILNQISLPPGETFSMDTERFILDDGDSIQAQASQNLIITATISYVQTA